MDTWLYCILLALGVSADALACGFGAGVSRIKVPALSACAAAVVSAAFVGVGMTAGNLAAPYMPAAVHKYVSFFVLAAFALLKFADTGADGALFDGNRDRTLSVREGAALGAALSVDGLAAGFGVAFDGGAFVCSVGCTFAFTALSLYGGAKGGAHAGTSRAGNIAAGVALLVLAAQKLTFG